jgi:hypothetical protein
LSLKVKISSVTIKISILKVHKILSLEVNIFTFNFFYFYGPNTHPLNIKIISSLAIIKQNIILEHTIFLWEKMHFKETCGSLLKQQFDLWMMKNTAHLISIIREEGNHTINVNSCSHQETWHSKERTQ